MRQAVVAHEVDVVGDLEDLADTASSRDMKKMLHRPTEEEMLAAAVTARDGLRHLATICVRSIAAPELGIGNPAQRSDPRTTTTPRARSAGATGPSRCARR